MYDDAKDLLKVTTIPSFEKDKEGKAALAISVSVNPQTSPYLVRGFERFYWVKKCSQNGELIAAVVPFNPKDKNRIYQNIITEIYRTSYLKKSDFCYQLSFKGFRKAHDRMEKEGYGNTHILCNKDFDWPKFLSQKNTKPQDNIFDKFRDWKISLEKEEGPLPVRVFGSNVVAVDFLSSKELVLVPSNRELLGTLGRVSKDKAIIVVSNPLRGISILKNER